MRRDVAGTGEYAYALSRIQARRRKWGLFIVLSVVVSLFALFMLNMSSFISGRGEPLIELICFSAGVIPFVAIVIGALVNCPTAHTLEARERRAGDEFLRSQQADKHKTKPKREYSLSDDGELVEVVTESAQSVTANAKRG